MAIYYAQIPALLLLALLANAFVARHGDLLRFDARMGAWILALAATLIVIGWAL